MKINNFILSNSSKSEDFEYGIEILPKRIPDRLTDSINVSIEKNIKGKNRYNLSFKRKRKFEIINNNYSLSKEAFDEYINFLLNFIDGLNENKKNKKEFNIENQGKIVVYSLNKELIKISAVMTKNGSCTKVFFTLLEKELFTYIDVLKDIYFEKCADNYLNYQMDYLVNPITKEERKSLYVSALYAFIDNALDNRDKKAFNQLAKEVNTILSI